MRHVWLNRTMLALAILVAVAVHGAAALSEGSDAGTPTYSAGRSAYASGSELSAGRWVGGGGAGVLGSTPDGAAFAMNGSAEYFVSDNVSIGPLVQVGFTGDQTLLGVSGQGKYWIDLPGTSGRGKLALQGGLGFAHADFRAGDTSWLVPIGVSYDYSLPSGMSLTATTLVNFTNLRTGAGSGADVMPGLTFGVRF